MRIARESLPFVLTLLGVALVGGVLLHPLVALASLPLLVFVLWFFRDPERSTPGEPGLVVSPADGRVIQAGPESISVFMNVFNVHVCRAPTAGTVEAVDRRRGRFLAAFKDLASEENERVSIVIGSGDAGLRCTLIAGLIARRIVCKVEPGQPLERGQRVGLIQFGSRVDVALPGSAEVAVSVGQRVVAGETIIARLPLLVSDSRDAQVAVTQAAERRSTTGMEATDEPALR